MKKLLISGLVLVLAFGLFAKTTYAFSLDDIMKELTSLRAEVKGLKSSLGASVLGSSATSMSNATDPVPLPPVLLKCVIDSFIANPSTVSERGSTAISWATTGCSSIDLMGITSTGEAWDRGINTNVNGSAVFGLPDWTFVYGNTGVYTFTIRAIDINGTTLDKTIYVKVVKSTTPCISTSSVGCGDVYPLPPVPVPSTSNTGSSSTSDNIGPLPPVHSCSATLSTNLSYGVQGSNDVLKLQKCLKEWGYLSTSPNGNFGPKTLEAVKKLQSDNGLPPTGLVGSQTRALISNPKGVLPPLPPVPSIGTTLSADVDDFIKGIPDQIASLQAILKDPAGFKAEVIKRADKVTSQGGSGGTNREAPGGGGDSSAPIRTCRNIFYQGQLGAAVQITGWGSTFQHFFPGDDCNTPFMQFILYSLVYPQRSYN